MISKTKYSRCRLSRITIDRDKWRSAKELEKTKMKEKEVVEQEQVEKEDFMLTEEETLMADWHRDQERPIAKRKWNRRPRTKEDSTLLSTGGQEERGKMKEV